VLHELSGDVTPEDAAARFAERQRQHAEKLLEGQRRHAEQGLQRLKGTGLLFDLYHPLSALRHYDLQLRAAQRSAAAFIEDLRQRRFDGLSLRAPASAAGRRGASCATSGHLRPPHFAFDPDADTLIVGDLTPAASIWELHDLLAGRQGLAAISWPRPASSGSGRQGLAREVRARFASKAFARAAGEALATVRTNDGRSLCPALAPPSAELQALVAPPEMSHPERIHKDMALSARVIRHLDKLSGIPPEITDAMLNQDHEDGSEEARLDVQVLYLRRVHHFCFYAAALCEDEWDLHTRCGSALLRDGSSQVVAEGEWARAHDERLERFLAEPALVRPAAPCCDEEPVASRIAALLEEKTQQVAEAKFRCLQCSKHFRGPEYVHKHIRKMHTDVLEAVRQHVHEEAADAAYVADPNRPMPPPPQQCPVIA